MGTNLEVSELMWKYWTVGGVHGGFRCCYERGVSVSPERTTSLEKGSYACSFQGETVAVINNVLKTL